MSFIKTSQYRGVNRIVFIIAEKRKKGRKTERTAHAPSFRFVVRIREGEEEKTN
jgi:hypothetical protein